MRRRPSTARPICWICDRVPTPLVWCRSYTSNDRRGHLGRTAGNAIHLAFTCNLSDGDGFLGLIGIRLPGVELGIALSALLLGAAVCAEARPKLIFALTLVGCFGLFHGHAHGTELPPGQSGLLYSMGFVIATGCLHAIGIALGLVNRGPIGKVALGAGGAFIALMGAYFVWGAIA